MCVCLCARHPAGRGRSEQRMSSEQIIKKRERLRKRPFRLLYKTQMMTTEVNDHALLKEEKETLRRPDVVLYTVPPPPRAKQSAVNTGSYVRSNHGRSDIRQHFPWLESVLTSRLPTFSPLAGLQSNLSFISRSPGDP